MNNNKKNNEYVKRWKFAQLGILEKVCKQIYNGNLGIFIDYI